MTDLHGTGALARLILRRDRVLLAAWVVALAAITAATAAAFERLFATPAARALLDSSLAQSPVVIALVGPPYDLGTAGGFTAWRLGGFASTIAALMSLISVVRHTRAEEDAGRRELLASTAVGRHAPLAAALLVTAAANLALAALVAAALGALGLPPAGALALGASYAAAGWVFAGVAAVTAQLAGNARAARGLAGALLGLAFLLRAAGDSARGGAGAWLSWLSPIGWAQKMRAFAGERFELCALAAAVAVALAVLALRLSARRDLGSGYFPARAGAATAAPSLRGAFGLAWRLHRGALVAWTLALALAGAAIGGMARAAAELLSGSVRLRLIAAALGGAGAMVDTYLAATAAMLGVLAAGCALSASLRLCAEEEAGRAELLLSAPLGRVRWAASHLGFAALAPAVALLAAGAATGLTHGVATGAVARELPRALAAAAVQLPAVWVLAGFAAVTVGWVPRAAAALSWSLLAACLLIGELGQLLGLGRWLTQLSPFAHVPRLPAAPASATPLLALLAVAAGLVAVGLVGLRRRDLT
jgi:ABC-2 type transport system permease protein